MNEIDACSDYSIIEELVSWALLGKDPTIMIVIVIPIMLGEPKAAGTVTELWWNIDDLYI